MGKYENWTGWLKIIMTNHKSNFLKIRRKEKEKIYEKDDINNDNNGKSRISQIQKEFNMSDLEMDGISKFTSSLPNDISVPDVLEELIKYEDLNMRQKVAFAHMLGIFRVETGTYRNSRKAVIIEKDDFKK